MQFIIFMAVRVYILFAWAATLCYSKRILKFRGNMLPPSSGQKIMKNVVRLHSQDAVYQLQTDCITRLQTLARSQYSEDPATGHLDTCFSRFPCAYKQTLRWLPTFQVATTCFSCSSPNLNLLVTNFIFCVHVK